MSNLLSSMVMVFGGSSTPGSSDAALYIADLAQRGREHFFQPLSRSEHRQTTLDELVEVAEECARPGWDGYGALPISHETYRHAYLFVEAFPLDMPMPKVVAEPDGHLSFEWYQNPRRTLSVSVSEEGDLHYSALIGRSTAYGTEAFYSEVPRVILELINRINIA